MFRLPENLFDGLEALARKSGLGDVPALKAAPEISAVFSVVSKPLVSHTGITLSFNPVSP
jgi:hypothetical protein